jgi:tetratricopeptide (TPR) repeat protein
MFNLLFALAAGALVAVGVKLFGFPIWGGIIPGVAVFLGVFILLGRRIAAKVQALSSAAQKELQTPAMKERERQQKVDKAVKLLEEGLQYDRWQFLVAAELHAQIGMIKYMVKDLEGAQRHFSKAHTRNYMARAMEGALHYQKKDFPKMEQAFEQAVKSGKKEALVWAVYAWCEFQRKDKDKALKIMGRAVEANPSDDKLKAGLTALQNDKKLKMKAYEPMWWQFGLEAPPMDMTGGRRVQFQRR